MQTATISMQETGKYHAQMPKEQKTSHVKFQLRMYGELHPAIAEVVNEKKKTDSKWSMNEEINLRLNNSLKVPEDIAKACLEFGNVKDRLDFAVRIFKEAGVQISIPED